PRRERGGKSASPRWRMPNVRSKVTRVATPSANVLADVPTTRVPVRHERATASAFCAPTPMIRVFRPSVADRDEATGAYRTTPVTSIDATRTAFLVATARGTTRRPHGWREVCGARDLESAEAVNLTRRLREDRLAQRPR